MGRKRVIDQEQILDAAEKVVARDGAARLTLESVAELAGISKASVLYDFKSKQALIAAVVERAVRNDNAFNDGVTASLGDVPSAAIRGRIAAAAQPLPEAFRATALNLCAALAQDRELRATVQDNQAAVIAKVAADAAHPRGALLAYLALEGLKLLEAMDLHHLPAAQRTQVLADINWLVDAK
jgi:AcrR family transcriptional regulator